MAMSKHAGQFDWIVLAKMQERTKASMLEFLMALSEGKSVAHACERAGVQKDTYYRWRQAYPKFRDEAQKLVNANKWKRKDAGRTMQHARKREEGLVVDFHRDVPGKGDFTTFRQKALGRPTPPHHVDLVRALEDRTNLVVIFLGPPGSGKDTIAGDWLLYEHIDDRVGVRSAWFMESEDFSKRRMARLEAYLVDPKVYQHAPTNTPGAQVPEWNLVDMFGPFKWKSGMVTPDGTKVERPTWTKQTMYFLQSVAPEADPNLWATGITGATYGSRIDNCVLSDPFTLENQRSPTIRATQLAWTYGTLDTRLDEDGRLIVLGTMLPIENNYEEIIKKYTEGARVLETNGVYTKYSNGTATVIYQAIQRDDDGNEVSYWEDRFPLHGKILHGGKSYSIPELSPDDELDLLSRRGAQRVRGLVERRFRDPDMFSAMYQQKRNVNKTGDFTDMVLDAANDPERTFQVVLPDEVLVLGIDPARSYGAAWVMWAVSRKKNTITLVDYFFGEKLGTVGVKEKLILHPLTAYQPLWMCYEINKEAAVLDDFVIKQAIKDFSVNVHEHLTTGNRSDSLVGVGSLAFYMRSRQIRFPTQTIHDRNRLKLVKDHFKAWDSASLSTGRVRPGTFGHEPDDIAMAAWVGFLKAREILERNRTVPLPRMPVPNAIRRKWENMQKRYEPPQQGVKSTHASVHDLVKVFVGAEDED